MRLYDRDDSGGERAPNPESSVESRNRIDWRVHQSLTAFLEGKGLSSLCKRFSDNITERLHDLRVRTGSNWEYCDDLMKFTGDDATISIISALCGPHMLRLNPNFIEDYWEFDRNLQIYLQGTVVNCTPQLRMLLISP